MATLRMSTLDRQSNPSAMALPVADAITDPQAQSIIDAWDAVILGSAIKGVVSVPNVVDVGSATPPADEDANRGNKWLMRVQDDVNGKIFTYEIGVADNSQLPSPTDDFLDITAGVGLAIVTAVETGYESPYGNAGSVLSVQQVNRGD